MRRRTSIIQISGFRGILISIFIISCLVAGFVIFPAYGAMRIWNFTSHYIAIPTINIMQGLMLWAIIAISLYIVNDRKKYLVAFNPKNQLSEEEMKHVLEQIQLHRAQVINSMILKTKEQEDKSSDKENV